MKNSYTSLFGSAKLALRHSVLVRLGLAMSTLALLTFLSIAISTSIADSSSGKANAINISGSLRMMSFRLLSQAQQPAMRTKIPTSIAEFEQRLGALEHFVAKQSDPEIKRSLSQVSEQWHTRIRPLAGRSEEAALAQAVPEFVKNIDHVVYLIEIDLERQIRLLRVTQFALLGVMIVVTLVTAWMVHQQFFRPLLGLLKTARAITQGSFDARVHHLGRDELGKLGQAFNTMMDEIASMYGHLEEKVTQKTQALTQTNQSLELLYRTSEQLSASDLTIDVIQKVLREIEAELALGHTMICVSENAQLPAKVILSNLSPEESEQLCAEQNCQECFNHAHEESDKQTGAAQKVAFFSLTNNSRWQSTLPVLCPNQTPLPKEKVKIIQTVAHHIANALTNMHRTEEKHRLAVLEERSVIARELHDSIAQSLSYLKIQITRLEKSLPTKSEQAAAITEELKKGLNAAYRELRDLITTFRLRVDERGFNTALQETVEEFSQRCGFTITVSNALADIVLSGNEQMHVTRIIREALTNIDKHAHASAAYITITLDEQNRVSLSVRDNGRGIDLNNAKLNHYGLIIMRDRATILGATFSLHSLQEGGTEVSLSFQPEKFGGAQSA